MSSVEPQFTMAAISSGSDQQVEQDEALDLSIRSEAATDVFTPPPIVQNVPEVSKKRAKPKVIKSKSYADEALSKALVKIRETAMPLYAASKVFGIPRTTLQYRLSSEYRNKGSRGPYTIFSAKEEKDIVRWLHDMERKGFPITQDSLRYKVSCYLKSNPRPTPFTDNTPDSAVLDDFQPAGVGTSHVDLPDNSFSVICSDDVSDGDEQLLGDVNLNIAEVSEENYTVEIIEVLTEATATSPHVSETTSQNLGESAHTFSEKNAVDTFAVPSQVTETPLQVFKNVRKIGHVSGDQYEFETIDDLMEAPRTALADVTNQRMMRKPSVSGFFISPPTPKRDPHHRKYANRTNLVLTADERLEELRILEEKKVEALEQKKKRAEMREIRKKKKKQNRRQLNEELKNR